MRVIYHLGAHCTDEDRLLRVLLKNRDLLAPSGIIVPGPGRYRQLIRQTIQTLEGAPPTADTQEALLDAIVDEDDVKRLIISGQDFLAFAPWVFVGKMLYCNAVERIQALSNLFPDASVEFFFALRNPATFIPAVFDKTKDLSFLDFMIGTSPYDIRWSELVHRIRATNPDAPVTVWCNEDTPLIWHRLLTEMAGIDPATALQGESDHLAEIMTPEGLNRYLAYLETNQPQDHEQRSQIISVFLEKFAICEKIEEELDLPGWTGQLVATLTEKYEQDLLEIGRIEGVNFITP